MCHSGLQGYAMPLIDVGTIWTIDAVTVRCYYQMGTISQLLGDSRSLPAVGILACAETDAEGPRSHELSQST